MDGLSIISLVSLYGCNWDSKMLALEYWQVINEFFRDDKYWENNERKNALVHFRFEFPEKQKSKKYREIEKKGPII